MRNEWAVLGHMKDLVLGNINSYLIDTAYLRLKVPKMAKIKMAEDASYIEVEVPSKDSLTPLENVGGNK